MQAKEAVKIFVLSINIAILEIYTANTFGIINNSWDAARKAKYLAISRVE